MATGTYRFGKRSRPWRRQRIREAAKRYGVCRLNGGLRSVLVASLALELAVGAGQLVKGSGADFRFIRREEHYAAEWLEPSSKQDGITDVYGVQIDPGRLEVRFYHRMQEVLPPIKQ